MPHGQVRYEPDGNGGLVLELPGLAILLDRTGALGMAASILGAAGVTEATFKDGSLTVRG